MQADELAVNFCFANSKGARRRLVRTLCDVPRASLQLLPFYARVIAVLAQALPDVPAGAGGRYTLPPLILRYKSTCILPQFTSSCRFHSIGGLLFS